METHNNHGNDDSDSDDNYADDDDDSCCNDRAQNIPTDTRWSDKILSKFWPLLAT